ncbi:hypothetical protein SAMN05216167_1272 [Spirosoma endophyticum]|uniref:Uncharacterized protein n=1 Tax=Spirosoma endophyticum TaxID=662367 RepID=A0A1I2FPL3_9BACT|nr:hypothetical protein SAMN05216167_1272 [Spirosoma endophyticum]
MRFNERVILLLVNGLCYDQLPLKIVQKNLRLILRQDTFRITRNGCLVVNHTVYDRAQDRLHQITTEY